LELSALAAGLGDPPAEPESAALADLAESAPESLALSESDFEVPDSESAFAALADAFASRLSLR
jgi:hypothetical protein